MTAIESVTNGTAKKNEEREYFVRFTPIRRIEHLVLMVTFIVLAITGLTQRYYTASWAEWVILNLGGIEITRLIHRGFAVVFTMSAFFHFGYATYSYFVKHRNPTMIPTFKDFRDAVDVLRYTFGFTDQQPLFGRFDYRQKFEYWGLMFGGLIIIITGFILAFPTIITKILPGEFVAAAAEFHGFEATLAVLTIVIWHLYDVIFRPGVFPGDTSIFTGKISLKRMLEEHPLEYSEKEVTTPDVNSNSTLSKGNHTNSFSQ